MKMNTPYKRDYDISEIKKALLNREAPFPPAFLYFFSDITRGELEEVEKIWPEVWTERRRGLLEDMETLSEKDTLLFFDHMAVMCLIDPDPIARATAIRLLWQSDEEALVPKLIKMLREDPEVIVRAAAATALGVFVYQGELEEIEESTYDRILKNLIEVYTGTDDRLVRRRALEALGYATHPDVPGFIQQAYETDNEEWLQSALFAMGRTCNSSWVDWILDMFTHPDSLVRYEAVRAVGELEAKSAREALFDLLEEGIEDEDTYLAAIWSLSKIGGRGVRELIETAFEETDDPEEIRFLEEALDNLNFTEHVVGFDMMYFGNETQDVWPEDDSDDY
jgi:HEAT repeat protein